MTWGQLGRFVGRTAALSASSVFTVAIGALLVPLQARYLQPEVWGAWQLTTRYTDAAHGFVAPGLAEAASRSAAADLDGNYALIAARRWQAARRIAIGLAVAAAGYALAGVPLVAPMLVASALAFPWIARGSSIPEAWLAAKGAVPVLARLRLIQSLTGLSAFLGVWISPAHWTYALWLVAASVVSGELAHRTALRHATREATDAAVVDAGHALSRARLVAALTTLAEPFVLERLLGLAGLAAWGAAQVVAAYYKMVLGNARTSVVRRMYGERDVRRKLALVLPWTRGFAAVTLLAAAVVARWGEPAFALLLGARYPESTSLGVLITAAVLAVSVTDFYGTIIQSELDPAYNTIFFMVLPVVTLGVTTALGLWGGLTGVCIARLVNLGLSVLVRGGFMLGYARALAG